MIKEAEKEILFFGLFPQLFQGRINRRTYIVGMICNFLFIVLYLFLLFTKFTVPSIIRLICSIVGVIIFNIINTSLITKRVHDLGYPWSEIHRWHSPKLGYFPTFASFFKAGDKEENMYGNPPKPNIDLKSIFR